MIDLLAFHPYSPSLPAEQSLAPGETGGLPCEGAAKLAQRVLVVLLTRKGSMRYDPAFGTTFMSAASSGAFRTPADVRQAFYASRLDLTRQIKIVQAAGDPPSERLAFIDLTAISVTPGGVSVTIAVATEAGGVQSVAVPVGGPSE